jgi:glycine cleavage system H protein
MMKIVEGLLYSKEHEWVKVDGNTVTIGITDFAQDQLGDIVFVELPMEDDEFSKDDVFGVIESVKAASDIFMPVSGVVLEANFDLEDAPEDVNENPYESWMVKVELTDESELEDLMDAKAYKKFCESL